MSYEWMKFLHIVGVITLLGNISVTAWWKGMANRTGSLEVIRFAQRQVTLTDYIFTLPGALLIVVAGDLLAFALLDGQLWELEWLNWGRGLFLVVGLLWLLLLIPIQIKQARILKQLPQDGEIPRQYWQLSLYWNLIGSLTIIFSLGVLYLMITRQV